VIRDRMRVTRRARVLTAQTQFSKRVLLALPIVLFAVLIVINPHYMEPLFTSDFGRVLLSIAGINLLLGTWVMNRLAVIRF
jgi:tight adherence protein B